MTKIHVKIIQGEKQNYDEGRNHLELGKNLIFHASIKEHEELDTILEQISPNKEGSAKPKIEDNIRWVYLIVNNGIPKKNLVYATNINGPRLPKKFKFPSFLIGGGKIWLEPFLVHGSRPSGERPNGCFVSAIGVPKIKKTIWTDYQDKEIEGPVRFGSKVRLHIYTEAMYGQEIEVTMTDKDIFSPDDSLPVTQNNENASLTDPVITATAFRREVYAVPMEEFENGLEIHKGILELFDAEPGETSSTDNKTDFETEIKARQITIQKTTIDVFVDPFWGIIAGESLKIYPLIKSEKTGNYFKFDRDYLEVKDNAIAYVDPYDHGNTAVIVGHIETNIRVFDPCRYAKITAGFEGKEKTIFDEKNQVNTSSPTINTGVVANGENRKKFKIEVQSIDTDGCLEDGKIHIKNVIDVSAMERLNLDYEHQEGGTSMVSFIPLYPYKYSKKGSEDLFNFFLEYFPFLKGPNGLGFVLPITTCAYQKKINFLLFPDALFCIHVHIGAVSGKQKFFYKEIKVPMVKGLDSDFDKIGKHRDAFNKYLKYFPPFALQKIIQDLILGYLQEEANNFAVGIHALHSFLVPLNDGPKEGDFELLDYSERYPLLPKAIIIYGVVCSVVLDALIIYLTRGGRVANSGSKLKLAYRRYKQYKTVKKLATGNINVAAEPNSGGWDFVAPSIARSTGIGFVQGDNGAIHLELTEKVAASPLFAMSYGLKGNWGSFLASITGITGLFDKLEVGNNIMGEILRLKSIKDDVKKATGTSAPDNRSNSEKSATGMAKNKKNRQGLLDRIEESVQLSLTKFAKKYGQEGEVELYFTGFIDAHYEMRLNNAKGLNLTIFDDKGNNKGEYENSTGVTYGCDYGIVAGVKMDLRSDVTIKWSKLNAYTPKFLGEGNFTDTSIHAELEGEIGGSIHYETTYTRHGSGPLMKQQVIICTGIRGSLYIKIEIDHDKKNRDKPIWGVEVGKKPEQDDTPIQEKYREEYTELLKGFKIPFDPEPVFDESLNKYFD